MFCWHVSRRVSTRLCTKNALPWMIPRRRIEPRKGFSTTVSSSEDTSHDHVLSPNHGIYISASTDPYFNLTLEDWLFRHSPTSLPLLLIYRDSPCVVIGRNQNPWTEVNFGALSAADIPFIRRRSGGGTVYHDLGNTNFSVHLPRASFNRHATGELILRAVRSLGIDARLNDRNDVCVGPDKISSAYKIVNKRAYHHGTMLISTRLDKLGDVLRPRKDNIVTKGVASIRSPVCNLQQHSTTITHEAFSAAVVAEFRKEYGITTESCVVHDSTGVKNIDYIRKGMSELSTWDWAYGQTPEFTHTVNHVFPWGEVVAAIRSKHGIIQACSLQVKNACISSAADEMLGDFARTFYEHKRYGFVHEAGDNEQGELGTASAGPSGIEWIQPIQDVKAWLEEAMR